jgi:hypothetical protein
MNRRDVLKSTALLATLGLPAVTEIKRAVPLQDVATYGMVASSPFRRMVDELRHYYQSRNNEGVSSGISVPLATLPTTRYSRKKDHESYAEGCRVPNLSVITDDIQASQPHAVAQTALIVDLLTTALWRSIAFDNRFTEVSELTVIGPLTTEDSHNDKPDRIVTPKHLTDIAELSNTILADWICDSVFGIRHEMVAKYERAKAEITSPDMRVFGDIELYGYYEHTPIRTWLHQEAYIVECFSWVEANGFIYNNGLVTRRDLPFTPHHVASLRWN